MIAGDPHYHDMIASGMYLLYWFEISTRLKPEDSTLLLCYSNRVLDVRRFGKKVPTFMDSLKLEDGGNAFIRNVGHY
jgi:hypothetical protein